MVKQSEQSIQESAFLSIQWLSVYLGISPKSAYAMVEQDKVPHYRIGRLIRFKRSEIDAWMEGNRKDCVAPEKATRKMIRPGKRHKLDVDRIVRKAIDGTRGQGYTTSHGKPDQLKGLGKEVRDGSL